MRVTRKEAVLVHVHVKVEVKLLNEVLFFFVPMTQAIKEIRGLQLAPRSDTADEKEVGSSDVLRTFFI